MDFNNLKIIFKGLADETRLRIVRVLIRGQFNVNEICEILDIKQSRASRHLNILHSAGIINSSREGTWVYYSADLEKNPLIKQILKILADNFVPAAVSTANSPEHPADLDNITEVYNMRRASTTKYFNNISNWSEVKDKIGGDPNIIEKYIRGINGKVAVDLGIGSGDLLRILSSEFEQVIGIDNSEKMLKMAGEFIKSEQLDNIELSKGEIEDLPLPDKSTDLVTAVMVIHHVTALEKAVKEIMRVKKKTGRFIIVDYVKHTDELMRERYADTWLGFDTGYLKKVFINSGAVNIDFKFFKDNDKEIFILNGK